jgi:class 3 adenylate cyclase
MAPDPAEHRLAAVLHADAAGYSRLMGSDEEAAVRAVVAQRGIVADKRNKERFCVR